MVDDNLTLAQSSARLRRQTFERQQEIELEREQLEASAALAASKKQEEQILEVPAPEETPEPTPEVDPYFQTLETDPEIVRNALNENPVIREANRMIYGDAMIAQVMQARDSGNLGTVQNTIQPAPAIQLMMSESGQSAMTVALYMYGQNDPVFLARLRDKLGPVAFTATADAVKAHQAATEIKTVENKGLFSRALSVGGDISGLVTKLDGPEAIATGGYMFLGAMSDLANQVPTIPGMIIAADRALGGPLPENARQGFLENIESAERMEQAQRDFIQRQEDVVAARLDTVTGQVVAGITEFALGWVSAPLKVVKGSSLAAEIGNSAIRGAVVDNAIYDDGDGNLTSMLLELGVVETNLIIDLLSPDIGESEFERRLAVTLEGVALGVGIDALIGGVVRGVRAANKGDVNKAAAEFDKAITNSMEKANEANKAVVDDINARAEEYYKKLAPESSETAAPVDTLEFNRIVPLNEADDKIKEAFSKYAKIQGRANDADLEIIESLTNVKELRAKVITEDAAELQKVISDRVLGVFGKIQEPKGRAMVAAMSSKIIERHGFEFMNADLQDAFRADVSKWSDEQSANLVAAATLEDMLQEQYFQVITELDSAINTGSFKKELFPGAEDVDDLRLIKEKIVAQRAILRAGRAKIANQAGRALRITRMLGKQDQKAEYAARKAAWKRDLGIINDKEEIALIKSILSNMKDKSTREISMTLDEIGKPRGMEKWLRVSNANLLTGLGTQFLMIGSNVARVLSEGLFRGIQGVILEPATAVRYWKDVDKRQKALTRASQQTRQAYLWYAALFTNIAPAIKSGFRYWTTGVSDFNARTFVDEGDNPFAGKTLKEIMKDDEGLKLLGRSEYLYRWMGSVDEGFKDLVVRADQQIRAATGEWGPGTEKPWYKVTQDDINKILETNPDAVPGVDGRFSDIDSVERAKEAMFQFEPVQGSVRGLAQGWLTRRNTPAMIARMLGMRFVSTPLAVMEQRFANVLAPVVLGVEGVFGSRAASGFKVAMGKFAADLDSDRMEVRQRARAVLLTNSLIGSMAITYYLSGQEWVNLDPRSPDYMKIRSPLASEGSKRWLNVTDAESPLNAFIMWTALFDSFVRAEDPTDSTSHMDIASAMMTLFIDETLEKSSLGNMMDSLSVIADAEPAKLERFLIQQATPFNPFGWYQRKALGWSQNSEGSGFDGRPVDFGERLGKALPPFQLIFGGVSNRLRNPLGELINPTNGIVPFVTPSQLDDPVIAELELLQAQTGADFLRQQFTVDGLDYTKQLWSKGQSVYDRAQQLISSGEIKVGGYTLREAMEIAINSKSYKVAYEAHRADLERQSYAPGTRQKRAGYSSLQDPRVDTMKKLLDLYRTKAVEQALKTIPKDRIPDLLEQKAARTRDEDVVKSVYQSLQ